jgi:hypothetical protein
MGRVHYWLPENGMERDDAYQCDSTAYDLQDAAEEAADDYHSNHDGWEASWPQVICVEQDGKTGRFSVDREARPHFMASAIPEPGIPSFEWTELSHESRSAGTNTGAEQRVPSTAIEAIPLRMIL